MFKWIGSVFVLLALSAATTGLLSALLDFSAFILLITFVARRAKQQSTGLHNSEQESPEILSEDVRELKKQTSDKIVITP